MFADSKSKDIQRDKLSSMSEWWNWSEVMKQTNHLSADCWALTINPDTTTTIQIVYVCIWKILFPDEKFYQYTDTDSGTSIGIGTDADTEISISTRSIEFSISMSGVFNPGIGTDTWNRCQYWCIPSI